MQRAYPMLKHAKGIPNAEKCKRYTQYLNMQRLFAMQEVYPILKHAMAIP